MGLFNVVSLTAELAVLTWYVATPLVEHAAATLRADVLAVRHFKQSLAALAALSVVRLSVFIFVRQKSKRAPATRVFVFFVFLFEAVLCTVGSLQPIIYWQDRNSFQRYRDLPWGCSYVYALWGLSLFSTALQLGYTLQLNKSRGRLSDDKLMRDVYRERTSDAAQEDELRFALWHSKWSQLVKQFRRKQRCDPTFEAIVRLYAHRSGAVEQMSIAYDRDPLEFEFYLPQLCSFLLLGAFAQSPQLCVILLEKCSRSHVFAHKMLWYLQSYCRGNPEFTTDENKKRVEMLIDEVSHRGIEPARVAEKMALVASEDDDETRDNSNAERADRQAAKAQEVEALLPAREEQTVTYYGDDLERGMRMASAFELESTFLLALANLSSNLRAIPYNSRNEMLRAWLSDLQAQYLPSNSLYLPVGNCYHRVKRIHVQESFTFSTRERVPYLLCAEVVDYTSPLEKKEPPRRRGSVFGGRRFTLNLWDKSTSPTTQPSATTADKAPLASPDALTLGFWSESKPAPSPRSRSFSQQFTSSIVQPTEILHGLIDTLVRKGKPNGKAGGSNEALLGGDESKASLSPLFSGRAQPVERTHSQSFGVEPSAKLHLTIDTSNNCLATRRTLSAGGRRHTTVAAYDGPQQQNPKSESADDAYSPRSDKSLGSPHSLGSPYSPPSLARFDSTDQFLLTLTERDSKLAADEAQTEITTTTGSFRGEPPPCVIFTERWSEKERRIQANSPFGHLPGWRLLPVIIKSNDDLRQEQLAAQLIKQFAKVFEEGKVPVFIRPYDVIAISATSGMVEAIADTISIDSLKRNDRDYTTLLDFFVRHFGDPSTSEFHKARTNFVSSMAAYSMVCYLLQVKDRHNGNILLDAEGHIIHIDFGFILSNNPGNMAFEQAPFKLTAEFVELMGGPRSSSFRRFRSLCVRVFLVARKYRHRFILLVEMMLNGNEHLPCFAGDARGTVERLAERFQPDLDINSCEDFVHALIDASLDNWRTKWYDKYQRWCVGVF